MISMVNVLSYGIYTVDKINSVCVNLEKKKKKNPMKLMLKELV